MVGTGSIQSVIVILIVVVFLHTIGYNFFVSSLAGNFAPSQGLVGSAGLRVLHGADRREHRRSSRSSRWPSSAGGCRAQYINLAMVQRALMTWSLDGLLPGWVSQGRRAPAHAARRDRPRVHRDGRDGGALAAYYASFSQIFALIALFGYMPILFVGISALLIKYRRPDLYKGSQAEWHMGGIEVLPIVGAMCTIIGGGLIFLTLYFHEALGIKHFHATEALGIGLFVAGGGLVPRRQGASKRQGIDIDLAYRVIPPE